MESIDVNPIFLGVINTLVIPIEFGIAKGENNMGKKQHISILKALAVLSEHSSPIRVSIVLENLRDQTTERFERDIHFQNHSDALLFRLALQRKLPEFIKELQKTLLPS